MAPLQGQSGPATRPLKPDAMADFKLLKSFQFIFYCFVDRATTKQFSR
jgi:hypothetical protein